MKSYCKGLVIDSGLVWQAYETWETKPSGRKNGWRVEKEYGGAEALVTEISEEIRERRLTLQPIRRYEHIEPTNGKTRVIGISSVKQQICDYVAVLALEPMLEAKVGYYQVASVPNKGQKLCRIALKGWVSSAKYHVKADIRQCYPSISHELVMRKLRKYVRSEDVLYLCETLLGTYDQGGLEIGSYFALRMAQFILSFAYHHAEALGRRRRGRWTPLVRHQIWHMDDMLLIGTSKRDLKVAMRSLEAYLRDELGLSVKRWKIARTSDSEPLDMGGFVVRRHKVTLRASLFLRAGRAFRRFSRRHTLGLACRCCSYWGWFKHSDSKGYIRKHNIMGETRTACGIISKTAKERMALICGGQRAPRS